MNNLLKKILAPKKIEYLTINSELAIVEISWGVSRFSDCAEQLQLGEDVSMAFPELIGLEETFKKILLSQINQFELKGISRTITHEHTIYFDIYVLKNPDNSCHNQEILIVFEDTTEWILKEQKITQVAKEYGLALSALQKNKIYLDKIINSMNNILIVTDNMGIIKVINQATSVLLKYLKAELIQQSILLIFKDHQLKNYNSISFKQYNDHYGHLAGDFCLQQVAQVLQNVIQRNTDLVARYGGEEFAIILSNTDIDGSIYLAEKVRQGVEALKVDHLKSEVSSYVTISIGLASLIPIAYLTPKTLVFQADQALYKAKNNGRNCIFIASQ